MPKIVIDISEETYQKIKNDEYSVIENYCGILSIQNGIPLDDILDDIRQEIGVLLTDTSVSLPTKICDDKLKRVLDIIDRHILYEYIHNIETILST